MNAFASFVIKETRHILRDTRTVMILFGMPIVMMVLFGFAISTDIRNVRVAVVGSSLDESTLSLVQRLDASEYFTLTRQVGTPEEAERLVRSRKADMAVVFTPNFANHAYDRTAGIQIMADAAEPNTAVQQASYAQSVMQEGLQEGLPVAGEAMPVNTKMLYNPQMLSSYNFVPGILGMLLMLICAMMTAVSIVREKERGTMEVLLVSPVRPIMVIIAKAIPYLVLSMLILACILLLSIYVLKVPIAGSLFLVLLFSLIFIILSLSLGLLISVVANTQLVAILVSAMVLLMPSIMLSGMLYPVENMPLALQAIAEIIPAKWFLTAMRKLMIMGVGLDMVIPELVVLSGMTLLLLGVALKKFKERLE